MKDAPSDAARRPLRSRSSVWAHVLARLLAAAPVTPNQISVFSVVWAGLGAGLMLTAQHPVSWLAAAACVQLRLLCNLLDGMVAVEGKKASPLGVLYNELPDRIADSLLLVAPGYAADAGALGWLCALLAALTAYVRVFGGALGLAQNFDGILAKPRRMALLTAALVLTALETQFTAGRRYILLAALVLMALGCAQTCITRTRVIARALQNASA